MEWVLWVGGLGGCKRVVWFGLGIVVGWMGVVGMVG